MQTYEKKIVKEQDSFVRDYNGQFGDMEFGAGTCEFCGHKIGIGYRLKKSSDNSIIIVGCECVVNLVRLTEKQKRILKREHKINVQRYKYSKVIAFLIKEHKLINSIEFEKIYNMGRNDYSVYSHEDEDFRYYKLGEKYGYKGELTKQRKQDTDSFIFHQDVKNISYTEAGEVACEIVRKANTTTNVNKYWLDKYEELTGINISKMIVKTTKGDTK